MEVLTGMYIQRDLERADMLIKITCSDAGWIVDKLGVGYYAQHHFSLKTFTHKKTHKKISVLCDDIYGGGML